MGIMISSLKEIEELRFEPFPTKPIGIGKIVRVDGVVFATSSNNERLIYTTSSVARDAAFLPGNYRFLDDLVKALKKLKIVEAKLLDEHKRLCEARSAREHAEHDLQYTIPNLQKDYGITLKSDHMARVRRVAKTGKGLRTTARA